MRDELPHNPRPAGASFRRITEAVFEAARSLSHLEFRVLLTMYEIADPFELTLTVNRSHVARLAGTDRTRTARAISTLAELGFVSPVTPDQMQLNPAPSAAQRSSQGAAQRSTAPKRGDAQRSSRCGAAQQSERRSAALSGGCIEAGDREREWYGDITPSSREGSGPSAADLIIEIAAWGGCSRSVAARAATDLLRYAEQHQIPDPEGDGPMDPFVVAIAAVAAIRLQPDAPGPAQPGRLRPYFDSMLGRCAAEGVMPGEAPVRPVSEFEQGRQDLAAFADGLGGGS